MFPKNQQQRPPQQAPFAELLRLPQPAYTQPSAHPLPLWTQPGQARTLALAPYPPTALPPMQRQLLPLSQQGAMDGTHGLVSYLGRGGGGGGSSGGRGVEEGGRRGRGGRGGHSVCPVCTALFSTRWGLKDHLTQKSDSPHVQYCVDNGLRSQHS
jgi:uncharacterized membrane protein YgcG